VVARPQDYWWSSFTRADREGKDQQKFGDKPPKELEDNFDDF
jgi:hypothetical protein